MEMKAMSVEVPVEAYERLKKVSECSGVPMRKLTGDLILACLKEPEQAKVDAYLRARAALLPEIMGGYTKEVVACD